MIKAALFDLDGTLYLGKVPIGGAAEALEKLRSMGIEPFYLTNAATRSRENVALKLASLGFKAKTDEVYCGSYLLARYIAKNYPGKKAYVVGEKGMFEEFAAAAVPLAVGEEAELVAVGLDRSFTYEKLCKAHLAIAKGAAFLASNTDRTFPTEIGVLPGAGAIVHAIEFSSGKKPYVVGKPNPYAMELILKEHKLKKEEVLVVGDRLETDILFAKNCGVKSALVLTGAAKKDEIKKQGIVPDYVLDSVADLPKALAKS